MNKEITPPDQKVRDRIKEDVDSNFLVEAGAGSGKTRSLVERMTSLISSGKYKVGDIAAITFTRKAAAELRERFQNELEDAYSKVRKQSNSNDGGQSESDLRQVEERLQSALEDLDEAFVGTIHSFASTLLKERPVEAGLDPDFDALEELEEEALEDEIFEEFLLHTRLNRRDLLDELDRIAVNPQELKESFKELSKYPDVEFYHEKVDPPDLKDALKKLQPLINKADRNMPNEEPDKGYDKLQQAVLKTKRYSRYFDMNTEENMIALLNQFNRVKSKGDVILNRWQEKDKAVEVRDEAISLRENIVDPVLTKWKEYCHYQIMQFLIPAIEYYNSKREKSSYLNFNDLLLRSRDMLRDYPEVRSYFQKRYKAILVDEFQDTDPLQSELVFYLTGMETEEKDWQKLTPYPGSLFVVGDPKQSIYRFRRADIDIYNFVKKIIKQNGGEILELTTNFRSVNSLGSWFDQVFAQLLPQGFDEYQAKHTPLETVTPDPASGSEDAGTYRISGVRKIEVPAGFTNQEDVVEENARQIAQCIRKMLEAGPEGEQNYQPADFMIILRYRALMDRYARALEDEGIPVAMTGGSSMGEAHELHELYKLLAYLNDLDNQVYLVAVLRGIFCGIDDDTLFRFKQAGGRFNIFSPGNLEEAKDKGFDNLLESFARIKKYLEWKEIYSPAVCLEKIINDLGLYPFILTVGEMKEPRSAYLYQVLEYARELESQGKTDFSSLVKKFEQLLSQNPEEELDLFSRKESSVRLLNLHKAKGLQARVVFLANPGKKVDLDRFLSKHIQRFDDKPRGYFSFFRQSGFSRQDIAVPPNWEAIKGKELKYQESEETRLLYVAATRAKELLVISDAAESQVKKKNPWQDLIKHSEADIEEIETDSLTAKKEGAGTREVDNTGNQEEKGSFSSSLLEKALEGEHSMLDDLSGLKKETYIVKTPTDLQKKKPQTRTASDNDSQEDSIPATSQEDVLENEAVEGEFEGALLGTVIHRAFELIVKDKERFDEERKHDLITQLIEDYYGGASDATQAKDIISGMIDTFLSSNLFKEIKSSPNHRTEVPFHLRTNPGENLHDFISQNLSGKNSEDIDVPIFFSGTIDLVYQKAPEPEEQEEGRWVIVDYKTDRVDAAGADLTQFAEIYLSQLKVYKEVFEIITGEKVWDFGVYFARTGEYVSLNR